MTEERVSVAEYLSRHQVAKVMEDAINEAYKQQFVDPIQFLGDYFTNKKLTKTISKVVGREILDSRGNPTVEVDVYSGSRRLGRASCPSGASTGSNEAKEIRDKNSVRYLGLGVQTAVSNVNTVLAKVLNGKSLENLGECDKAMVEADGTELKEKLGGNAITACSFAVAVAGANLQKEELFLYLARQFFGKLDTTMKYSLPTPMVNILNGGKHAGGKLKIQEFMVVPVGDKSFAEALMKVTTIYHHLGKILVKQKGKSSKNLGDEGGFAPNLDTPDEALTFIEEAIKAAGYEVGKDAKLALDCAASEFYDGESKKYEITEGNLVTSDELIQFYEKLIQDHPALCSIEDGFDEQDYEGWKAFTKKMGDKIMIVGDDVYTTNTRLIRRGIEEKWANALLLKVNQIGAISEAMEAARMIQRAGQNVIVSHRSGETETTLISDLAVALGAKYIKTGATARGERVAKYNRLLQIEEYLKENNLLQQ
jgi:enolase